MTAPVEVEVAGLPAPQGSKVRTRYGMREASKAVGPWRDAVRTECQKVMGERPPLGCPVVVHIEFRLPRPKNHFGSGRNAGIVKASSPLFPAGQPDLDKLCRAVLDGLTAGGAWNDDGQVVHLHASKDYADGTRPGCRVRIGEA